MKADRDFSKITDKYGKHIGLRNFNNMIPVCDAVLLDLDIAVHNGDSYNLRAYKELMRAQLRWCNENRGLIVRKVQKI